MFNSVASVEDFPNLEKKWLDYWKKNDIYNLYLRKNNNSKKFFSFLDGPITANNPMGVHHAWGRTYKDLWQKFYNLLGYRQRFQNGFDCQGLWVEVEVEKELGLKSKKDIENLVPNDRFASIDKFVNHCKERVYRFSKIQTNQSIRLGYFMDWKNSYYTMSDENNYMIWFFLKKCYENGWIYKGQESVPWCPRCQTAISEHEILTEDYKELVHESVYFKLKLRKPLYEEEEYLLVWTTTPWTIPANVAVAVDEDINYVLVETKKGDFYWVAEERAVSVFGNDWKRNKKVVKGKDLVGLKYISPFDDLPAVKKVEESSRFFHIVVASDKRILPINTSEGTGMVHTAVSAGTEDYRLGRKLGLPMIPVIDDEANYLPNLGFLSGKNAKLKPRIILDYLENKGFSYKIENYCHRYPVCWRCKTELVWKVAEEWYIAMDKKIFPLNQEGGNYLNLTLRQRMIEVAKRIKWIPDFGLERELDWLRNMHDWLISKKNRYWGLSLPIYECKNCGFFEVIGSKEELEKKSVVGWDKFLGHSPHKPWIDEVKIRCQKCNEIVSRIEDVGNPWLDAGIVAYSTITKDNQGKPLYLLDRKEWQKWFPADFITESFPGQFKNWFYSLIAMSTVLENKPPFKTVLGFGTLLGEDGRPMHKSWGNSIEFNEGADKIGVDVMRWLYCRHKPEDNLLFGYRKADEVRKNFYLILWNCYRFFVEYANLDGFKKEDLDFVLRDEFTFDLKKLNVLDRWILSLFAYTAFKVRSFLIDYNARDASLLIEEFVQQLSTWYVRRSRDRVWVNSDNKEDKKNFYQVMYYVLVNLSIIISPFLPFVSEEIYHNLTKKLSVHLEFWPKIKKDYFNKNILEKMNLLRKIVEAGHRERKRLGQKTRYPLLKIKVDVPEKITSKTLSEDFLKIAIEELNVKNIIINRIFKFPKKTVYVSQKELQQEGELRELIRIIQDKRKRLGLPANKKIKAKLPLKFSPYFKKIAKKTLIEDVEFVEDEVVEIA